LVILLGVSWQVPMILLGLYHGPSHLTPFIFIRSAHPVFASLYLMALLSGIRKRPYRVTGGTVYTLVDRTPADMTYGVECQQCDWATPICAEPEQADMREAIHTRATGHGKYSDLTTWERQRRVI
jgi:hypothetical protein